jgi:hypothetical protein
MTIHQVGELRIEKDPNKYPPVTQTALRCLAEVSKQEWDNRYELEIHNQKQSKEIKILLKKIQSKIILTEDEILRLGILELHSLKISYERIFGQLGYTVQRKAKKDPAMEILENLNPEDMPQG